MAKKKERVVVPADEVGRQAVEAINGYVYQLHQTVLAWFNLGSDELLHIEFAEDIAVSDDGKLELVQVKRVAASVTMRSEGITKLLKALWTFQQANPSRSVTAALVTTSKIAKEKGITFPGKLAGLHYWRIAAREGSDVEPIRSMLMDLDLPPEMKAFVKGASASDLRKKIIRPVRWLDRSQTQDALDRDIEERLIKLGNRLGVAAQASVDALDSLVGHLIKSLRKAPDLRFVTAAELLMVFQKKTFVSVPPGVLEGLTLPSTGTQLADVQISVRDVALVPMPPRIAQRNDVVNWLQKVLVSRGLLWLHGSSGLGKTTLALLIARYQGVSWRFADLRDMPLPALRSVLAGIAEGFRKSRVRGLILDDIPANPDNVTTATIGAVARAVADADGVLIVTSTKIAAPSLRGWLNLAKDATVAVPYLNEEEVGEIVTLAGGDPNKWARNVHIFAGGHPQLVDARVVGLRQRGWNTKEALAVISPIKGIPNDMEDERKLVRTRLLQDLDGRSVEFLLRLSLLSGNFSREMAMVVANVPPPVQQPGLQFDGLLGPWIEQVGENRHRLSPLLNDSGTAGGLTENLQNAVKSDILGHLLVQRPFPADQLLQVFLIAFQLNDRAGLRWFAGAVINASTRPKQSEFRRLAEAVSVVSAFDRGKNVPLFADDLALSTLLRFAQLRIAVGTGDFARAATIVDRVLYENSLLDRTDRQYFEAAVYGVVLVDPNIPMPASRWMQMLADLTALPIVKDSTATPLPSDGGLPGIPSNVTRDEMLFIIRASAIRDIESLKEFIAALDERPKAFRDHYLGAAARVNHTISILVASAWLAEVKRPEFDARAAAVLFEEMSQTSSAQENNDLAVELICAQAVMLDEYANDRKAALDVLERAERIYPMDYRLSRQRQKIFYRNNQHEEALAEFEKFRDRMPKDRLVDRAYTSREAGRSAAETGDMDKARLFFSEAWEASHQCGDGMQAMTAGLSADCAILHFDGGQTDESLSLMQRSLEEADGIDPKAGLRESFVKRIQIAAILYMRGRTTDWPVEQQSRVVGMCSEPEPQEWFRKQPQAQPSFVWYTLAELEAETSSRQVVLSELRRRTASGGLLPMEIMLTSSLVKASLRDGDVDRFIAEMPSYLRAMQQARLNLQAWGGGDMFNQPVGHLTPVTGGDWKDPNIKANATNTLLTFMLCHAVGGLPALVTALREKVASIPDLDAATASLLTFVDDPTQEERDFPIIMASIVGRLLRGNVMDANDAFRTAVYSLVLLENSALASVVAQPLMTMFERVWPEILQHRSFSMRAPSANGPLILEAMRKGETALQRLANMTLVTEAAVRRRLPDDLRSRIGKIAVKKVKKKLWDEEGRVEMH